MSLEAMDELFGITDINFKPTPTPETVQSDNKIQVAKVEQIR